MADHAPVIHKLRQLGLTRSEAETYVAALQEAAAGPVSGYRVAQSMGRDPANLTKTLAALEKHGAVRVVQEKPRLYLPLQPEDFTAALVGRMQEVGQQLVGQLEQVARPRAEGLTLALRDNEQALEQASLLLRSCTEELLIFASRDVVDYLGKDFGDLASRSGCRVRFLGCENSGIALAEETIIPLPADFKAQGPLPWLFMIVDRRAWLTAQFHRPDQGEFPCGWWSDDPALAMIMAAAVAGAFDQTKAAEPPHHDPERSALTRQPVEPLVETTEKAPPLTPQEEPAEPVFESGVMGALESPAAEAGQEPDEPAPVPSPEPTRAPAQPSAPAAAETDPDDDDDFEFVVRHDDEDEDR